MAEREEKNQPYHCLSLDEWIRVTSVLTYSEVKVFYYLLASNPLGNRQIDCRIKTIANSLGISTGATSTALKQLEAKGLIESVEIIEAKVVITPKLISAQAQKHKDKISNKRGGSCAGAGETPCFPSGCNPVQVQPTETQVQPTETQVQPTETQVQPTETQVQPTETQVQPTETQVQPTETQVQPKPLPGKPSSLLPEDKNYKEYKEYINTLSKSERESFEKYVREEWKRLTTRNGEPGEEIVSIERFLARVEDRKNWWDRFVNSSAGRAAKIESEAKQYDWENDPRFMDWLHKAYSEGYPWAQEDEAEREQRTAFLWWAQRTNAYAGRIEHESA